MPPSLAITWTVHWSFRHRTVTSSHCIVHSVIVLHAFVTSS